MDELVTENEFQRLIDLKPIEKKGLEINVSADEEECAKLATRFSIPAILNLEAKCTIKKRSQKQFGDFQLNVSMNAEIIQECVMTLDNVNESISEDFSIVFQFEETGKRQKEEEKEVEFSLEDEDLEIIQDSEIDLGRYIAEYLSLAMNPYPRQTKATTETLGYKILSEEEASEKEEKKNPFAVLKDLKH